MSDVITANITGLAEIEKALNELPGRIANKVLRKGVFSGAALLRGRIKEATWTRGDYSPWDKRFGKTEGPKKMKNGQYRMPGYLKANIKMKFRKNVSNFGDQHYAVGPLGMAFYGYFVEGGHKTRGGGSVAPHPFIMPAFNSMQSQIVDKVMDGLTKGIVKEGIELGLNMTE